MLCALLAPQEARGDSGGPWAERFADLARLETLPPNSSEFRTLFQSLLTTASVRERAGLKSKDHIEKFRARTILYHLRRLEHLPSEPATEPDRILTWLPHEAWYATRALRPGLYRIETAVAALDESVARRAVDPARVAWAERMFEEQRLLLDLDLAERLAAGLYRHAPEPANVVRLAYVHQWRGNADGARAVLSEALALTVEARALAELHRARARVATGSLDERAALSDYGAALALGDGEAALDLGWRALLAGQRTRGTLLAELTLSDASPGGGARHDEALALAGIALLPVPERTAR